MTYPVYHITNAYFVEIWGISYVVTNFGASLQGLDFKSDPFPTSWDGPDLDRPQCFQDWRYRRGRNRPHRSRRGNSLRLGGVSLSVGGGAGSGANLRWEGEPSQPYPRICGGMGARFTPRYPTERRVPRIEAGGRKYPPPMGPQIRNSKGGPNFVPLFALVRLSGSFLGSQQKAGGIQKNIPGLCLPMLKSSR